MSIDQLLYYEKFRPEEGSDSEEEKSLDEEADLSKGNLLFEWTMTLLFAMGSGISILNWRKSLSFAPNDTQWIFLLGNIFGMLLDSAIKRWPKVLGFILF